MTAIKTCLNEKGIKIYSLRNGRKSVGKNIGHLNIIKRVLFFLTIFFIVFNSFRRQRLKKNIEKLSIFNLRDLNLII